MRFKITFQTSYVVGGQNAEEAKSLAQLKLMGELGEMPFVDLDWLIKDMKELADPESCKHQFENRKCIHCEIDVREVACKDCNHFYELGCRIGNLSIAGYCEKWQFKEIDNSVSRSVMERLKKRN